IPERDVRTLAWNSCGILRSGPELQAAYKRLECRTFEPLEAPTRAHFELRSIHQVAFLIAQAAFAREESRGGHYRVDFPYKSAAFEKHSILQRRTGNFDAQLTFE
ncbi:MAG: hypothetical protein JOZ45_17620, partial [Acidobacteriaceae bacterium]|nr:hypothetical protein [Acidobacteriaceae bacterium]